MANSVYNINKGVGRPVEFKGFKAQYIWHLGVGLVVLLIAFALMYLIGINTYVCLGVIVTGATAWFLRVRSLSHKYGEHGMMKKLARRALPRTLICRSRNLSGFSILNETKGDKR